MPTARASSARGSVGVCEHPVYGNTPVWLAAGLTTVFCSGLGLLFAAQGVAFARLASRHPAWRAVQFASLWVLFEWLRSWLLTGFPWLYAGYGALDSPLAGWIPVVGVYGASWFLVAIGCLLANALSQPRDIGRWVGTAAVVGPLVLAGLLCAHSGPSLRERRSR